VLRVKFDSWLLKKAEESGVFVINGSPIEKLAWNNGRVTGIIESGEVTTANSVIVADGANSRIVLNEKFGGVNIKGKTEYPIENMALGIKEVYKLDEKTINDRFNITYPYGVASEYLLGFLKNGVMGGGFLYTNKESISLGVVINLPSLKKGKLYSYDIIEDYKTHPFIAPLIEGGSLVEYSAHLIPEGGPTGVPKLAGNGYLVVGDAASLCYSNGVVIQGMNYAIRSGMVAAETLINAKKNNWVDKSFQEYIYRLKENHLLEDIEMLSHVDRFSWNERLHHTYPYLITDILNNFIGEHGNPKKHIRTIVKEARKKQGISNLTLMRDMLSWGWRL
jgi:electron transfer flavoprotein-quinone oxidoreductase